mgnify:CR=1 FL=1
MMRREVIRLVQLCEVMVVRTGWSGAMVVFAYPSMVDGGTMPVCFLRLNGSRLKNERRLKLI